MTYLYYGAGPSIVYDNAVTFVAPNDAAISVSDHAGTFVQDSGKIRLTRDLADASNYQNCAPGARVRFAVTLANPGKVEIDVEWTGLVTRTDTYNTVGEVWVNGAMVTTFTGPSKALPSDPHPTGNTTVTLPLLAGARQIEVIFPYCASMDYKGARIPATASVGAATARPTRRGVFFGDSIPHGFNNTKAANSWAFKTAVAEAAQILNNGRGGLALTVGHYTTAGAFGCDFGVTDFVFNNFYPNGANLTTFKNNNKTGFTNWRTASTAAGKPNAPLYVINGFWAGSDDGLGPYAANSPTLEQFRQAIRDAITEQADPYVILIEGRGAGMPTGIGKFPDLIHPNDLGSSEIYPVLAGIIT